MAVYTGTLNPIPNGQGGSVIPVSLTTSDVPASGLTIDTSRLLGPAGQLFGFIRGLVVDASNTNVAVGIVTVTFPGTGVTRFMNGGVSQTIQVPGQCQQVVIQPLGNPSVWTTGTMLVNISNTSPPNENQSPINIGIASGSAVTIEGTPTVDLAAGSSITIDGTPTINIGADNSVSIIGTTDVSLTGANTVEIDGTVTVEFTSGSQVGIVGDISLASGTVVGLNDGTVVALNDGTVVGLSTGTVVGLNEGTVVEISGTPTVDFASGATVTISGTSTVEFASAQEVVVNSGAVNATIEGTPSVTIASGTVDVNLASGSTIEVSAVGGVTLVQQNPNIVCNVGALTLTSSSSAIVIDNKSGETIVLVGCQFFIENLTAGSSGYQATFSVTNVSSSVILFSTPIFVPANQSITYLALPPILGINASIQTPNAPVYLACTLNSGATATSGTLSATFYYYYM